MIKKTIGYIWWNWIIAWTKLSLVPRIRKHHNDPACTILKFWRDNCDFEFWFETLFSYELKIIVNTFFFLRSSRSNFFFSDGSRDNLEDLASRDEDFVDFVDWRELETESDEDNLELLISFSLDSSLVDCESFKIEDFVRFTISRAFK